MKGIKVYIDDDIDKSIRKIAMERFGYGKGSLSKAVEASIAQWIVSINYIDKILKNIKEKAEKDKNIIAVYLFGSYVNGDKYFDDIDIAFLVKDETKFDKSVYRIYDKLDISVMQELPLNIQMRIFENGKLIVVNQNSELLDYYFKCFEKWEDFKDTFYDIIGVVKNG
ncbi:MAG: nucleotidyltransferase domain-containing protein [Candidatus Parvarchaeum sp.]